MYIYNKGIISSLYIKHVKKTNNIYYKYILLPPNYEYLMNLFISLRRIYKDYKNNFFFLFYKIIFPL